MNLARSECMVKVKDPLGAVAQLFPERIFTAYLHSKHQETKITSVNMTK